MKLTRRVSELAPSATLQAKADAEKVRREGIDVIDFGPGEPDFHTPEMIKDAAKRALDENFTHYTETAGIAELREGLAGRYRTDHEVDFRALRNRRSDAGKDGTGVHDHVSGSGGYGSGRIGLHAD